MNGKLSKVISNNTNLRTASVEGIFDELPEIGKRFELLGESLTPGKTARYVGTSEVTKVASLQNVDDGHIEGYYFNTLNSIYYLELT